VDHDDPTNPPLSFTYVPGGGKIADEGVVNINIDDFSLIVTRDKGLGPVSETIPNASFSLTATGLTEMSSGGTALGRFETLAFEISAGGDILLTGSSTIADSTVYEESSVADTMFLFSDPLDITGGTLAGEFAEPATLAGSVAQVSPSTTLFDALDTDHTGSVNLLFTPIPEPATSALLMLAVLLAVRRANRHAIVTQ
jgi:hypothetical protein